MLFPELELQYMLFHILMSYAMPTSIESVLWKILLVRQT